MENSTLILWCWRWYLCTKGKKKARRWTADGKRLCLRPTVVFFFFVCMAVLASNQFFFVCIADLASNHSDSCLQWWYPPWCSEEGAAFTIRLGVTCKQLSVLATLVIVFQKLFYHFQFEYQTLERVKCLFALFFRLVMSCRQLPPVVAPTLVQ